MLVLVIPVLVTSAPVLPDLREPEWIVPRPLKPELLKVEPVRLGLGVPVLEVAVVVMPVLVL